MMLDELEGPGGRATREFRQKFPDEIVTDNLGGQLWFGAECLAAGSSIMNKEFESEQMRPLAKAVTKTLEKVRSYLREQCLSPTPHYTEEIHENLKISTDFLRSLSFPTSRAWSTSRRPESLRYNRTWSAFSPTPSRGRSKGR